MIKNYDESVEINYNRNWPYIPDHPYRILIIVGSWSSETNVLLNLIKHQQPDIDKIFYTSNIHLNQSINCLLMKEIVGIEKLKNPKAFINYWQTIDDVYENLEDYNLTKKRGVLIVFDYMIADVEDIKKLSCIVT